jgi:hypothetical protein
MVLMSGKIRKNSEKILEKIPRKFWKKFRGNFRKNSEEILEKIPRKF